MRITADHALQVIELTNQGTAIADIAISWGTTPNTLYRALKRHGLELKNNRISDVQHLDLQERSGIPPEIYAHRAGLTLSTLRRYAWQQNRRLATNTYQDRKNYWLSKLDQFSPANARAFCALNDLPVLLVAQWYHRIIGPSKTLLWGFNQLLVVPPEKVDALISLAEPDATIYALGQGKTAVPIGIRTANDLFSFAHSYQH